MSDVQSVSVNGKQVQVTALTMHGVTVVSEGRFFTEARVFDEYWLERKRLPDPDVLIAALRSIRNRPDLFTFTQRVPNTERAYSYRNEPDNYAVLSLTTFDRWLEHLPASTRRNVRASEKRGLQTRVSAYDDEYVRGIVGIYNETPIRAGRRFWHFGKSPVTVKQENGTFADRSTYLAAYHEGEMVGYLKIVWDEQTAAIMQILSKTSARELRPNNALLAEAVRQCCMRNVKYLLYERYDYGNKRGDSLTRFKQSNGFVRVDVPRYYVPLTRKGALVMRLGLHRRAAEHLPEWIAEPIRNWRSKWYESRSLVMPARR